MRTRRSRIPPARCLGALLCTAAILGSLLPPARAADVLGVRVARRGTTFVIGMRIRIDASPRAVFAALRDYSALPRYDPALRRVRVEPTAHANRVRLFATVHACVLIFCKTLHQEQIMTATTERDGGRLRASLVPGSGDFRAGEARWSVRPCPGGPSSSCLHAEVELEPNFWMPPLIGPWLLRRKMLEQARQYGRGLQRIARHFQSNTHRPVPTGVPVLHPGRVRAPERH